jgi:hypothetical protein
VPLDHGERRFALGAARCFCRIGFDDGTMPVLCQRVADVESWLRNFGR